MDNILNTDEYNTLRNSIVFPSIILLGYGGSYAYGTNVETSDIDLRGIALNPADQLIGVSPDFEQWIDESTDTVIYSFKKILKLLADCNPNTIEILGLRPEDYFIMTPAGQKLLDNSHIFLSKKAIYTFGNYAKSQLNRLINRSGRANEFLVENEKRSLSKVCENLKRRYPGFEINVSKDEEVKVDWVAKAIPAEKFSSIINELNTVHKDYKRSVRNDKAAAHGKLTKHAMHLIRLYMMGIDILEKGEINTFRGGNDHRLLMDIRSGKYMEEDGVSPAKTFEDLVLDYQKKFDEAAKNTRLPDKPDFNRINKLAVEVNSEYLFN